MITKRFQVYCNAKKCITEKNIYNPGTKRIKQIIGKNNNKSPKVLMMGAIEIQNSYQTYTRNSSIMSFYIELLNNPLECGILFCLTVI